MVSTTIVHIIGFTALIAVLATVIGYVGYNTQLLITKNEEKNFEKITEAVALQLRYLFEINTNISIVLRYPVEVIYNREYNIIIGSGEAITSTYSFITGLDSNTLYVVAVDFTSHAYTFSPIAQNFTSKPIILNENPKIFGSTTITVVEKIDTGNYVYLNIVIKGVRKS